MNENLDLQKIYALLLIVKGLVDSKQEEMEELLTVREVMKELKISRNSFNRLKDDGIISVYSLRGKLYCKRSEIMQTIENCRVN